MTTDLAAELAAIVGPGGVLGAGEDLARYADDWTGDHRGRPRLVVRPRSTGDVAAIVRLCAEARVPLVPQGGHTGLVDGATPSAVGEEIVLSLERMNRIRGLDADDFSIIAEAGCILAEVKAAAEAADLHFPLSLGAQGSCRIGGNVSTNAGGLNVLRYGMTRDLVLGLEVVLPDGTILSDLRCLRKNNTGYDLKQIFIGAEGTLGIVTAAALKLFPRQTERRTALLGLPDLDAVVALFGRARRGLGDLVSAFELLPRACIEAALAETGAPEPFDPPAPVYVLMEAATSAPIDLGDLVERFLGAALEAGLVENGALAASEAQAAAFWRLREGLVEWQMRRGRHLRTDVAVKVSAIPAFVAAVEAAIAPIAPEATVHAFGHVGDGNIHINVLPPVGMDEAARLALIERAETAIFDLVDRFGGTISAEHGIGRKKRAAHLARLDPAEHRLATGLKQLIDPRGIMSPGRIL
jgi:FAD/FMN-containing dehydrogenase